MVQGNIPQNLKWNREYREQIISQYERLTEEAEKSEPQLIVWPETATPGFVLNDFSLLRRMASLLAGAKAYLLIGSSEYPKFSGPHFKLSLSKGNTALLFSPQGRVLGQYLKMRLVPFGEYIPYKDFIPWPDFIVQKGKRTFDIAGREVTLFRVGGDPFGTLICWEVLFPDLTRNLVKKGAGFAVNLTNEAWFGKIAFPQQMLSSCVFRAVENRINLVRCANTGISCFIDPYGRVTSQGIQEWARIASSRGPWPKRFIWIGPELFIPNTAIFWYIYPRLLHSLFWFTPFGNRSTVPKVHRTHYRWFREKRIGHRDSLSRHRETKDLNTY